MHSWVTGMAGDESLWAIATSHNCMTDEAFIISGRKALMFPSISVSILGP